MNEIIEIRDWNGKKAVSGRDLHYFLEVETPFHKWIPRMLEYGFIENVDWTKVSSNNQSYSFDYALSMDCAKEISMIQRTEKGKIARQYFIECEKQLQQHFAIPKTYSEALMLASKQAELIESQQKQLSAAEDTIKHQSIKVEYHDRVLQSRDLISTSIIAKDLGMSATALNKQLHARGIIYQVQGVWVPYSKYQDKGYCHSQTFPIKHEDGSIGSAIHYYWTERGREFIMNLFQTKKIA